MTREHLFLVVYCFIVGIIPTMLAILLYMLNRAIRGIEARLDQIEIEIRFLKREEM